MEDDWEALEGLVLGGFLREVVGVIRREVPDADEATIVGAVIDAMVGLIDNRAQGDLENLSGYLFTAAKRALVKRLQRDRRFVVLRPNDEMPDLPAPTSEAHLDATVARVDFEVVLAFIRALVSAWESDRMRVVVEIYLDGIAKDLQLEAAEVRDLIEDTTGDVLTVDNVWKLKQRGFSRLAREVDALAEAGEAVPIMRS